MVLWSRCNKPAHCHINRYTYCYRLLKQFSQVSAIRIPQKQTKPLPPKQPPHYRVTFYYWLCPNRVKQVTIIPRRQYVTTWMLYSMLLLLGITWLNVYIKLKKASSVGISGPPVTGPKEEVASAKTVVTLKAWALWPGKPLTFATRLAGCRWVDLSDHKKGGGVNAVTGFGQDKAKSQINQ